MAKTYNAFLKHISQLCGEMNYQRPLSQFDLNQLYARYLSKSLSEFKDSAKMYVKRLKADR